MKKHKLTFPIVPLHPFIIEPLKIRIPNQTRKHNKDKDKLAKQINLNPNSNSKSNTNKTPKSTERLIREIAKLEINQRYDFLLFNFYV